MNSNENASYDYKLFLNNSEKAQEFIGRLTKIEGMIAQLNEPQITSISGDPYVLINTFTLTSSYWWFGWHPYNIGQQYNINLKFTNFNNANAYENFIESQVNTLSLILAIATGISVAIFLVAMNWPDWAVAAFSIFSVIASAFGSSGFNQINQNIQNVFETQWNAGEYFSLVYTLNAYYSGQITYDVWASSPQYMNVYSSAPFESITVYPAPSNYLNGWNNFNNMYGQNNWVYTNENPNWNDLLNDW